MKSNDIRQCFLEYFAEKGHTIVPSSSLVPGNDPTLLFTNAGMVQFKEIFLGIEQRDYQRATSSQRCVRAGGKHNDLENVGYTARHHTFFEMLGNFSFGDYFKREAIQFAWEFLTDVLKIPAEKLWVTVFEDDDETADIWLKEMNIDRTRFSRCGADDNFWSMGDTGPCGPCTEIFYDHGPDVTGGPPGTPEQDGDRYVEIWNLVFMQYDRSPTGELSLLPKPSVDTGMGLERLAAVLQGVHNNYDTDLFQHLINAVLALVPDVDRQHSSLKVIADHIRSCAFLIVDGVTPSNEGRGYVLRRIIRRAARHGHKLGLHEPFFYQLVPALVEIMGQAYPELAEAQSRVATILQKEEEQFAKTLDLGLHILEQDIAQLSEQTIPGSSLFKLYDTYGFPVDLTADIARERNLAIDIKGFEDCMARQRLQSQQASQFAADYSAHIATDVSTEFTGYHSLAQIATIQSIIKGDKPTNSLQEGDEGIIILDQTPFYAESGGQVGDSGYIKTKAGVFTVRDTQAQGRAILHYGKMSQGTLTQHEEVRAEVDADKRQATMLNHSATHLLHAALRQELGEHVIQKGSLVNAERLRFDFAHYQPMTPAQIRDVERIVNQHIRANHAGKVVTMTIEEAKQDGALALFGEKYSEQVRVLSFGDFSKELCGGTHSEHTGDIGFFKIIAETGIASGVRRMEALTGDKALAHIQQLEQQSQQIAQMIKTKPQQIVAKLEQLVTESRQMAKQLDELKVKAAGSLVDQLLAKATLIHGVNILISSVTGIEAKALRSLLDKLKNKLEPGVVLLVAINDDKINVIAGMSSSCVGKVPSSRDLVAMVCGKGGGRDDMAQGGGRYPDDLSDRLTAVHKQLEQALGD